MLQFGIDRAFEAAHLFSGAVALVTTPTGRTSQGRSTIDVLREICDLRLLLAPEHGVRGDKAAGELIAGAIDEKSGLEMVSMYTGSSKRLAPEVFNRVDTIVYDIQDVGARYYTFISTLKSLVEDCAAHKTRLVVLDRPNPLGDRVEGTCLEQETESFVGCYDIPAVYGLTCGEFANMVNEEQKLGCDLHVVPCLGLERRMTFRDWGKPWAMPSPNIPRYETALLYPGTCLIEGTNLSEGRGTADPFAILGAPFVDADELCERFLALGLPGVTALPAWFTPFCSKHQGQLCGGIHLQITDETALRPVELGLRLLALLRQLYPNSFRFLPKNDTWPLPFINHLSGFSLYERFPADIKELLDRGRRESEAFRTRAAKYYLY